MVISACGKIPLITYDRIPPGSLRLGEVVQLATKEQIFAQKSLYGPLLSAGVNQADIQDGSIGRVRTFCCGGPNERATSLLVYIPPDVQVSPGDIVEIRSGRTPKGDDPGLLNTVTGIRQKHDAVGGSCRWDPPDERLWARVIFCDGMKSEGWSYQGVMMKEWVKSPE